MSFARLGKWVVICDDAEYACTQVMVFQPIALDEQAKDLLRAGRYEEALNLANVCAVNGAPWAETAFAQTALLLLLGAALHLGPPVRLPAYFLSNSRWHTLSRANNLY